MFSQIIKAAFLPALALFLAIPAIAAESGDYRSYSGYVERWKSVGTYRYVLMHKNGEAIVYIGDDYRNDLGNEKKRAVRDCLNEAFTAGARVEIGGQWVKQQEGAEGFDEQTVTCRILK